MIGSEEITQAEMHQDGHAPVHTHKHKHKHAGEEMSQGIDLQQLGGLGGFGGSGLGGAFAGALLGGVLGDSLVGRRDRDPCNGVDPASLAILSKLGDAQGEIAGGVASLRETLLEQNTFFALNMAGVKDAVQAGSVTNLLATKDLAAEGAAQTGTILAAIKQSELDAANRANALLIAENIALKAAGERAEVSHNTTMTMTNIMNQSQAQGQATLGVLGQIVHLLGDVRQEARATNTSIIAGNTGAVVGGPQTANPTNVNT